MIITTATTTTQDVLDCLAGKPSPNYLVRYIANPDDEPQWQVKKEIDLYSFCDEMKFGYHLGSLMETMWSVIFYAHHKESIRLELKKAMFWTDRILSVAPHVLWAGYVTPSMVGYPKLQEHIPTFQTISKSVDLEKHPHASLNAEQFFRLRLLCLNKLIEFSRYRNLLCELSIIPEVMYYKFVNEVSIIIAAMNLISPWRDAPIVLQGPLTIDGEQDYLYDVPTIPFSVRVSTDFAVESPLLEPKAGAVIFEKMQNLASEAEFGARFDKDFTRRF